MKDLIWRSFTLPSLLLTDKASLVSLSFRVVLLPSSSRERNSTFPPSVWSRITFSSNSSMKRHGEHAVSHISSRTEGLGISVLSAPRMTRLIFSNPSPRKSWGVREAGDSESEHSGASASFYFFSSCSHAWCWMENRRTLDWFWFVWIHWEFWEVFS